MILLVVFALIAIGFSFLCSILEAALLSITPSYIAGLKQERPKLFEKLRKLKDDIDDPLAAILTLNTIAHTAGATASPATVATAYTPMPAAWASPALTPARAEPRSVWRVTTARLAPGVMAPRAHTPINSSQSVTASMMSSSVPGVW